MHIVRIFSRQMEQVDQHSSVGVSKSNSLLLKFKLHGISGQVGCGGDKAGKIVTEEIWCCF